MAAASVAVTVAWMVLPMRHDPGLSTAAVVAGSAFVCGLLLAAETLPRLVVDRRQPFHSPDLLAADDAVRSWSAHAVTGALLATMLLVLSGQVMELGSASDVQVLRWAGPPVGIVLFGLAIGSFQSLSGYDWRWRVSRQPMVPAR